MRKTIYVWEVILGRLESKYPGKISSILRMDANGVFVRLNTGDNFWSPNIESLENDMDNYMEGQT